MGKRLGVNIDHVATLRQARRGREPEPAAAAAIAELAGADGITVHLREDRRHIQDRDLVKVLAVASVPVNLEMAVTAEMVRIAIDHRLRTATLVPERREEVTTEGGLDVACQRSAVRDAVSRLSAAGIRVSLFIDPDPAQLEAAVETRAHAVELHTGTYCQAWGTPGAEVELGRLREFSAVAKRLGFAVHAGHGLNVRNVGPVARIPEVEELNIGHALIGRAIFIGLDRAVAEMKSIIEREAGRR